LLDVTELEAEGKAVETGIDLKTLISEGFYFVQ